jgi:membrane protein
LTKLEHIILASKPVTFIREKSKKIFIPGFHGIPLHDVYIFFIKQVRKEGLNVRAAAISFNFIMAIPAATIFLFTLVPYLPISKDIYRELFHFVSDITPNNETRKLINGFLYDFFHKPKTGLLSIGFVLAMFYASNAMMGIIRTFDRSVLAKHKANFVNKRIRAIKLTIILVLLIIATALISMGQGALFSALMKWLNVKNSHSRLWIQNLRWIVIVALFLYSIAFIYKYAPSVHKRWKLLSPGAILATMLMILTTWLFSIWAQNFSNYNKFYGSIGTLLMLMLLVFLNSLILLIGYELNITITYLKGENEKKTKEKKSPNDARGRV